MRCWRTPAALRPARLLVLIALGPLLCCAFHFESPNTRDFGPSHPPTKGRIWPQPQIEKNRENFYIFIPSHFEVKVTQNHCEILNEAIHRYTQVLRGLAATAQKWRFKTYGAAGKAGRVYCGPHDDNADCVPPSPKYQGLINQLVVVLTEPCEDYPYFAMDESYSVIVSSNALLKSSSVWGILRGLESFSQMFYITDDFLEIRINMTTIWDYPRYMHRGLLIDTSRHFLPMSAIYTTLDAMAINKMNVLHWHIVDDQSFPYESERFPELSERGAYHPSLTYSKEKILAIVNYARNRGIRVIPEIDVPGHTRSWGEAYPNLLTTCSTTPPHTPKMIYGPLNPISNTTYKLLQELFKEVQQRFPERYIHIGGDEVDLSCWEKNPTIRDYMRKHGIKQVTELYVLFMKKTTPLLAPDSKIIVWQEVFEEHVPLTKDSIIQVWKDGSDLYTMLNAVKQGYQVLYSSGWYLDNLLKDFKKMYDVDPREMVTEATDDPTLEYYVVGGEACMWGEMVDERNLHSRVWPRASAVAERLWSPTSTKFDDTYLYNRIEEHVCRMVRRGVPSSPAAGPGFCVK